MSDRISLHAAQKAASELVRVYEPFCERIEVAGSIRRGSATVKDVEIVAIPKVEPRGEDLFGESAGMANLLHAALDADLKRGAIAHHEFKRWGNLYRKFVRGGLAVDLFMADADNWGVILAIRTGPADYSRWFMTQRQFGGAMPPGLRVQGGDLWRVSRTNPDEMIETIPTPTEESFFEALGLAMPPPSQRFAPEGF